MNINPASGTIDYFNVPKVGKGGGAEGSPAEDIHERLAAMRLDMFAAAENLDFEKAARLRDELKKLEALAGVADGNVGEAPFNPFGNGAKGKSGTRRKATAKPASASRGGKKAKAR
jgi:excinuclease ABC subunit B